MRNPPPQPPANSEDPVDAVNMDMPPVPPIPPFPTKQMIVIALCRLCEPIAFMGIFPYIYFMIQDFQVTDDDKQIAFYASLVTSSFAFAEFLTGMFWGRLSDRIGRKPILLIGLSGTAVSVLIFGFAPNLTVALLARALGGLLNGNIGVMQTTVGELVRAKEHQGKAFAVIPSVWCIGSIIGPAIGGVLARPCKFYPDIFPAGSIWDKYPYLLPNLFSAAAVLFGVVTGIFFLEETHPIQKHRRDPGLELGKRMTAAVRRCVGLGGADKADQYKDDDDSEVADETEPLLDSDDQLPGYCTTDASPHLLSSIAQTTEVPETREAQEARELREALEVIEALESDGPELPASLDPLEAQASDRAAATSSLASSSTRVSSSSVFTRPIILNTISFGLLAFHTMTYDQLLPIFLSTARPTSDDISLPFKFIGGFGFDNQMVGIIMAVQGFYSLLSNTLLFPWIISRFGPLRAFRLVAVPYFLLYLVTPYLVLLPDSLRMPFVFATIIWKCTFSTIAFPSNALITMNLAPNTLVLGTVNGISASAASLCRAFGPLISGFLFAAGQETGYSSLPWWCGSSVAVAGAFVAMRLTMTSKFADTPARDDAESGALLARPSTRE